MGLNRAPRAPAGRTRAASARPLGGVLYEVDPRLAFTTATAVGLVGVALFLAFGREFRV